MDAVLNSSCGVACSGQSQDGVLDVAVIGAGPAGLTAALYAARAGMSVAVFEKLGPGGQMVTTEHLDNYPGFEDGAEPFSLAFAMDGQARRFGSQTVSDEVVELDLSSDAKKLTCASGAEYLARTVILATGASPRRLGLEGEEALVGRGISYCATCDGGFFRGKKVGVVGGGNTAVGDALYLSRIAEEVHLIHRRNELRADAVYVDALPAAANVTFHGNTRVSALHAGQDGLASVTLASVDEAGAPEVELELDALFVAIGSTPNTALLDGIEVDRDRAGYIVADETCVTSVEGLFVAGDARTKALRQVITAASDGANAATSAFEYISVRR